MTEPSRRGGRSLWLAVLPILALVVPASLFWWGSRRDRPPESAARARPNVVLIVVDTLRRDHMGLYGYPRRTTPEIDRWFADGLVFEGAHAPTPFTAPSVMSLLTGLAPQNHRVRMVFQKLAPHIRTLADDLKGAGYHTAAVVSNMVLTDEATGLGSRFHHYDDAVSRETPWSGARGGVSYERNAAATTEAALAWLPKLRQLGKPHFLWLHYMDPHGPYAAPDDKPAAFGHPSPLKIDLRRVPAYNRSSGGEDGLAYVDRYDEEIAYADREIGRFLHAYARDVGLGDAVFVFVADHGESMMDHEVWFSHGYNVYEAQTQIPLMILWPGQKAERRTEIVSLLDLAPTILDLAGVAAAAPLDGRSLLRPGGRDVLMEGMGRRRGQQHRAILSGTRKWVIYTEAGAEDPAKRCFFDLARDPGELQPLDWKTAGEPPQALWTALWSDPDPSGVPRPETILVGRRLKAPKLTPSDGLTVVHEGVDEDNLERLKALGYVQ